MCLHYDRALTVSVGLYTILHKHIYYSYDFCSKSAGLCYYSFIVKGNLDLTCLKPNPFPPSNLFSLVLLLNYFFFFFKQHHQPLYPSRYAQHSFWNHPEYLLKLPICFIPPSSVESALHTLEHSPLL